MRKKKISFAWGAITFSFIILSVLFYLNIGHSSNFKQAIGFMWYIWAWFFFYFPKLIYMLISVWKYPILWFFKKQTSFFHWTALLFAAYAIFFFAKGTFFGRFNYQVNRITLTSPLLPAAFDGTKIVQISDIHIGNLDRNNTILKHISEMINNEKADYILQTGDLVNNQAAELNEKNSDYLTNMHAQKGKYAILGNHDYGDYTHWESKAAKEENLDQLKRIETEMGFTLLNNESMILKEGNDSIALIGVENWGEPPFPKYGDLNKAMKNVEHIPFKILMTHNPIHWDEEVKGKTNIFLTLSGHTHAMQMIFSIFGKRYSPSSLRYPNWEGIHEENGQYLYVNTGIGYVMMPFRYNCGPEITVFELKNK